MLQDKVLLIYIGESAGDVNWTLGNSICSKPGVVEIVQAIQDAVDNNDHEWVCCWDSIAGQPDPALIEKLIAQPVDAWHAGLMFGLGNLPDVLNYVHPTWMYNKNADTGIEHTSFRLSIRTCLVKTAVLKKLGKLPSGYSAADMFGVALGYKIIKLGGIIRYSPLLIKKQVNTPIPSLQDEWIFAKHFFTTKWQLWTLLNKAGFFKNCWYWLKTRNAKSHIAQPCMHPSGDINDSGGHAETVSVLAPTLNRYSYLVNELEQLSAQSAPPLEVLITDQTDKKDRQQLDTGRYPNLLIKYFPQEEKGQCLAWNKLLHEAKGDYVLFLGDDADGISPGFIAKLLDTKKRFDCDMVASNVVEIGTPPPPANNYYYMSDTFPITLIKKAVVAEAGYMDMFYNKNIRADHDLAMRCHLNGARMIFDPSAVILHHRAPAGGLRTHNARVITNHISKNSLTKFAIPASSEIYLVKKYYTPLQYKNYIRIKYFNQLVVKGNIVRKVLRPLVFLYKLPSIRASYKKNLQAAELALNSK